MFRCKIKRYCIQMDSLWRQDSQRDLILGHLWTKSCLIAVHDISTRPLYNQPFDCTNSSPVLGQGINPTLNIFSCTETTFNVLMKRSWAEIRTYCLPVNEGMHYILRNAVAIKLIQDSCECFYYYFHLILTSTYCR